jgi:hypothetical protein
LIRRITRARSNFDVINSGKQLSSIPSRLTGGAALVDLA